VGAWEDGDCVAERLDNAKDFNEEQLLAVEE
jgi:hypothetical protein